VHGVGAIADGGFVGLSLEVIAVEGAGGQPEEVFHTSGDSGGDVAFKFGEGDEHISAVVDGVDVPGAGQFAVGHVDPLVVAVAASIAGVEESGAAVGGLLQQVEVETVAAESCRVGAPEG